MQGYAQLDTKSFKMMERIENSSIEKGETDLEDRDEDFDANKSNGEFPKSPNVENLDDENS